MKPDPHNCRHEYEQEQAEQIARELHQDGFCHVLRHPCDYCAQEAWEERERIAEERKDHEKV